MNNLRINLSNIKGMNLKALAHKSDEVVKLVNLKPTPNGLEMRNSKQVVITKNQLIQNISELQSSNFLTEAQLNESLTRV